MTALLGARLHYCKVYYIDTGATREFVKGGRGEIGKDGEHIFGFLIFTAFENSETGGGRERRQVLTFYY